MSIARAFTKRLQRSESKRPTISGPVNLISSTNAASYHAPDINALKLQFQPETTPPKTQSQPPYQPRPHASPQSTRSSSEGSNRPSSPSTTEPTLTDASSVEVSPVSSPTLEKNHLSQYFPTPTKAKVISTTTEIVDYAPTGSPPRPTLPVRAPSHSKLEHVTLARKRSALSLNAGESAQASRTGSPSRSSLSRASLERPDHTPRPQYASSPAMHPHPFGAELAQLNEVAEEFERDTREAEADVDTWVMERLGLNKFSASDYLGLFLDPLSPGGMFAEDDFRESCWI